MNLYDLLKAEMQLWLLIGVPVAVIGTMALWAWSALARSSKHPKPKGPHISLVSPCPACGNIGCVLNYSPEKKCVMRKCVHCGCVLQQPTVAPRLFADK